MSTRLPPDVAIRDAEWLRQRALEIPAFYYPACLDEAGYHHRFDSDGSVVAGDSDVEPLVGTCRFIYLFAAAADLGGPDWCAEAARHGLNRLQMAFHDESHGGYYWEIANGEPVERTKYAYGHAFVLLAFSAAANAGIAETTSETAELYDLLETRLYEPEHQLYATEAEVDWKLDHYRGQNANMHLCEACLAAYEATRNDQYVHRAQSLADAVIRGLAANGDMWEHYDREWQPDWAYNSDDPDNLFRPHGYLPGHYVEWAKLLCQLEQHESSEWRIPAAKRLFNRAVTVAWDETNDGLQYAFDRNGQVTNSDKYYWVTAEQLAAAATLSAIDNRFDTWYERTWAFALATHMTDQGVWWRICNHTGIPVTDEPISPPNKTDYHVLSALLSCRDVAR